MSGSKLNNETNSIVINCAFGNILMHRQHSGKYMATVNKSIHARQLVEALGERGWDSTLVKVNPASMDEIYGVYAWPAKDRDNQVKQSVEEMKEEIKEDVKKRDFEPMLFGEEDEVEFSI